MAIRVKKSLPTTKQPKPKPALKLSSIQCFLLLVVPFMGIQIYILYQQVYVPHTVIKASMNWSPSLDWETAMLPATTSNRTRTANNNINDANGNPTTRANVVGKFNGHDITYHQVPKSNKNNDNSSSSSSQLYSDLHCIGEAYRPPQLHRRSGTKYDLGWQTRSCHFQLFCFDIQERDWVLFLPSKELSNHFQKQHPRMDVSQTIFANESLYHGGDLKYKFGVSIGGINQKWTMQGIDLLQWFPRIIWDTPPDSFYALPSNVVMLPFHSLSAANPGHLVWDDFLPIFTLLEIFQFTNSDVYDIMMMRYKMTPGFWAGCDYKKERAMECQHMLEKFAPLMTNHPASWKVRTQEDASFQLEDAVENDNPKSNYVCARHGLAGIGALTDHGPTKGHGWERRDYKETYNHGRGGQFWKFRNFMMTNMGFNVSTAPPPMDPKPLIVVSERSSKLGTRNFDFGYLVRYLQRELGDTVNIEMHIMKKLSLKEQVALVSRASMYITGCGGGAVSATFLPRGASVLIYYQEMGGVENNKLSGHPARLDWDFFNNLAYNRVHWLPTNQRRSDIDMEAIKLLVQHDLALMKQEREDYEASLS